MNRRLALTLAICVGIVLVAGVITSLRQTSHKKLITVDNNDIFLCFSGDSYNLVRIKEVRSNTVFEFKNSPLWKVVLLDTEKAKDKVDKSLFLELRSDDKCWRRDHCLIRTNDEEVLKLTWRSDEYGEVEVNIKLPRDSSITAWNITVRSSGRYAVWYVDFPNLNVKPLNGEKKDDLLALPLHGGALIRDPFDNIRWRVLPWEEIETRYTDTARVDTKGSYPGNYNAQFAALYDNAGGLYLASYDGEMHSKRFLFFGDGDSLDMSIRNYPSRMLTPGIRYVVPYEFGVGIFHGDWIDAADIYKKWAERQVWCGKGPMYQWKDLPAPVYEVDLTTIAVYRTSLNKPPLNKQIEEDLLAMKEFFDKYASINGSTPKIGVHWIGWSKYLDVVSSNSGAPNYLPPQKGFVELIDKLRSTGSFYNDVYLTLIGFDMGSPRQADDQYSWKDWKDCATYNPLGQVYTRFTSHTAWMDPSQERWQNLMINVSRTTLEKCHLDGEYFDWYPKYRLDFKHHEGGGNYFAEGYRKEALRIKNTIREENPNYYCYPEGKSEIEIGVFDAMLMEWFHSDEKGIVHSFGWIGVPIPLISYLYHEYIAMVGGIRVRNKDFSGFKDPDYFRLVSALIWAWGNKPQYPFVDGRRSDSYVFTQWKEGKLDPVWADNLRYLANLVKMYRIGKSALLLGEMVRPPKVEGIDLRPMNFGEGYVHVPSVVIWAFRSPDGRFYLPTTNWGEEDQVIRAIDFSNCEWINSSYKLSILTENSSRVLGVFHSKKAAVNLTVRGGDALFIVVEEVNS